MRTLVQTLTPEAARVWVAADSTGRLPSAQVLRRDRERAGKLLAAIAPSASYIASIVVPGEPLSKRGMGTRFRAQAGYEDLAACLGGIRATDNVALACLFYRSSFQRVDVDNMTKALLDAAMDVGAWADDSQVTAISALVDLDADYPRTVLLAAEHAATEMRRGDGAKARCQACGVLFPIARRQEPSARFCSRACRTREPVDIVCAHCGITFQRQSGNHRFCSVACRGLAQRSPRAICPTCGGPKPNKTAKQCRSCWRAS